MNASVPRETDVLCEKCGYTLNGLPATGRCPECGAEIDLSISRRFRHDPPWEAIGDPRPKWLRFLSTSAEIIFRPTNFYRTSTSRGPLAQAFHFAVIHWAISSLFFGMATWSHLDWYERVENRLGPAPYWLLWLYLPAVSAFILLLILATVGLAAQLTTWEAAYRGYRLPRAVVLRAMYYHAAHFLPVALVALITCGGYNFLQSTGRLSMLSGTVYLYVLCAEVIIGAGYLFNTYWIGMRNWMYANW